MRKNLIILLIFLSFLSVFSIKTFASSSAGFVSANNIWYSKDSITEGDSISIYTLVSNPDNRKLSGTAVFFDNDVILGKKDFIVNSNNFQEVHINWIATAGNHDVFGRIENAKFLNTDGTSENAYLVVNETEKSSKIVSKKLTSSSIVDTSNINSKTEDANSNLIQNIENTIKEKTPSYITQPINSTSNTIEKFRQNLGASSENKKEDIKKEIKNIEDVNSKNNANKQKITQNKFLKPFKYIQLFFLSLFSFIFNTKILFYLISFSILFFVLRFLWHKFF